MRGRPVGRGGRNPVGRRPLDAPAQPRPGNQRMQRGHGEEPPNKMLRRESDDFRHPLNSGYGLKGSPPGDRNGRGFDVSPPRQDVSPLPRYNRREERGPIPDHIREASGSYFREFPSRDERDSPLRIDRSPPFHEERGPPSRVDRGPPPRNDRGPPLREDRGPPPRNDRGPPVREEWDPPRHDRGPPQREERGPPPRNDRGPPLREERDPSPRNNRGPSIREERGPPRNARGPPIREERGQPPRNDWGPLREEKGLPRNGRGPPMREERGPPPRSDRGPPMREERGPPIREERGPPPRSDRGPPIREERGPPPRSDRGPPIREERGPPPRSDRGPPLREERGPPPRHDRGPPLSEAVRGPPPRGALLNEGRVSRWQDREVSPPRVDGGFINEDRERHRTARGERPPLRDSYSGNGQPPMQDLRAPIGRDVPMFRGDRSPPPNIGGSFPRELRNPAPKQPRSRDRPLALLGPPPLQRSKKRLPSKILTEGELPMRPIKNFEPRKEEKKKTYRKSPPRSSDNGRRYANDVPPTRRPAPAPRAQEYADRSRAIDYADRGRALDPDDRSRAEYADRCRAPQYADRGRPLEYEERSLPQDYRGPGGPPQTRGPGGPPDDPFPRDFPPRDRNHPWTEDPQLVRFEQMRDEAFRRGLLQSPPLGPPADRREVELIRYPSDFGHREPNLREERGRLPISPQPGWPFLSGPPGVAPRHGYRPTV